MAASATFPGIILIGRPAAGKSEIIDYLKKTPVGERQTRFHIGDFEEFDDFPYIWNMFQEDKILTKHGRDRIWTDEQYYFKEHFVWNFLIEKINLSIERRKAEEPTLMKERMAMIEFARGGENGFGEALQHLAPETLEKTGIVYLKVSYEESCRKNRRRARKGEEHSILHHSLPDEKMEFYYKENDWEQLTRLSPTHIDVNGLQVPYAEFPNEPEVTNEPELLGKALEVTLGRLWKIQHA